MSKKPAYRRCDVRCGALTVGGVRLKAETLDSAERGVLDARHEVVKNFIERLRELGIINRTTPTQQICYDRLTITPR